MENVQYMDLPPEDLTSSPQFSKAMENMDIHWWYWNSREKNLKISSRLIEILGYTEDEFDPSIPTLEKNIHSEDAAANIVEFKKLLAGEIDFYEIEYRVKIDGEWKWFYNRGNIIARDEAGAVEIVGGITMNLSGKFVRMLSKIEEGSKFEYIFKRTTEPIFIIDYNDRKEPGKMLNMNLAGAQLLAREPEEIIGKEIDDILDRILKSNKQQLFEELSKTGKTEFETIYHDRFGVEKYLEVIAHTFALNGKDLVIAIIHDKTESHLQKKVLKSSEMMFKSIFDNSTAGILIVNLKGEIEHVNPTTLHLTGMTLPEVTRKSINVVLQLENDKLVKNLDQIDSGRKRKIEFEKFCRFGDCTIWLWVTISGIRDENDELEYFMVMLEDITGRKGAENALRESENMYRQLIQSADDRIGLFDLEGNALILNSAYHRAIGFSSEEFLELEDKERFHPDDINMIRSYRTGFFKTGFQALEYRIRHKDGHYLHMSAKIMLVKGEEPGKDYILNIIRDITPQKEFQKELVRAKEKAEESDLLKSAFLANMSHEIRTPMNSIVGFSNLLSDSELDSQTRAEYIKRINKNSDQLLALISDIIDLSKIESNQLTIAYSSIKISSLFTDVIHYGEYQLKSRSKEGIDLIYDPDPENPDLAIDSDVIRLTQVLQNLINNAIKFTEEGSITAGFRLQKDNKVQFFVKDTGVGIDPQNFEIIFDQFRQIDGSHTRKFGGTGLGLAICKNLSSMLGGKIWVESERGKGSSFYIELALKGMFKLSDISEKENSEAGSAKSDLKIMMVDDDEDSLHLLSTLMRTEGLRIILADSGYRALQILESENLPDLIFMDLQMPVLNGLHTMRIIKDIYPGIKIIAQSAHAIDGDKSKYIEQGFDDYFSKPFRKQEILKVIAKHCGS